MLWRLSPISRTVLDSLRKADCWSLLTEYTFAEPVDVSWIAALPPLPDPEFEATADAHRDEWQRRRRALRATRRGWNAAAADRAKVEARLAHSGYRGIIYDADLLRIAHAGYLQHEQELASGPIESLPPEPVEAVGPPVRRGARPRQRWSSRRVGRSA